MRNTEPRTAREDPAPPHGGRHHRSTTDPPARPAAGRRQASGRTHTMPLATPETYAAMLDRAKAGGFAYPAINITSSETINGAIKGFADAGSDGIIQVSTGGGEFASGTSVKDMVVGAVALAEFASIVAARYDITVALHTDHCPKNN